jgi:hypothetical protein
MGLPVKVKLTVRQFVFSEKPGYLSNRTGRLQDGTPQISQPSSRKFQRILKESIMNLNAKSALWLLAVAVTLISTRNLSAQAVEDPTSVQTIQERNETYGTTAYSEAPDLTSDAVTVSVPIIKPSVLEGKASYATGGVSLRNRGAGNISVSGLVGPPRVTFIYWAVISLGATPPPAKSIEIQRLNPAPASPAAVLNGAAIGVGPAPCWGPQGSVITVFRAVVPPAISTGNGSYQVTLLKGAGGLVNGADPWLGVPVLPLFEGASLVMIGNGVGTVSVYDIGFSGKTFAPNPNPFNYVLALPVRPSGKRMLLDNIGADGQHVSTTSRLDVTSLSDETTTINGFPIAGPGSDYVDSDWNGSSGLPLPELWDDTGHNITIVSQDAAGAPANLNISIHSALAPADCLTPVANVVEED